MKKWRWIVMGIGIGLVVAGARQAGKTNSEGTYWVEKAVDGDTIWVNIGGKKETVRLIGVDTPESVDPRKPVQCFGREATEETKRLVAGKQVKLAADASQGERDKYSRLLRYVFLADGTNVNETLIANGFGHEYTYDLPYKYQTEFKAAEKKARETGKGLWASSACAQGVLGAQSKCGEKTKCSEMVDCGEAKFYLTQCGVNSLDSNGDRVPCEALCK